MTEKEAIQALKLEGGLEITGKAKRVADFFAGLDMAITALKKVQQYREIGTVEECREAVERQKVRKPVLRNDNGKLRKSCPVCGCFFSPLSRNCPKCGQAIERDENSEGMGE